MKNVSNDFKNIIKSGGPFFSYATAVLADGTSLTFDSYDDFSNDGNSYAESGGSGFPLGVALAKQIAINLENTDGRFSEYDFYGAVFTAYTEADLPAGTTERIPEGRFSVIDSVAPGDVLEITAYDNMYKLDSSFTSGLTYPATLQQMWNELCSYYDLTNGSPSFANNDFTVLSAPTGLTGRELAGYIAQLAIGNAIVDTNGRLCIKSYDFTPFDTPETVSADDIETESGIPILSDFTSDPDIGTDDVSITGVMTTVDNEESNEDTTLVYGTDVYALSISNPLIAGKESTAIAMIGDALIGVTVRPFSGSFSPNPAVEVMDLVYVVDKKDNAYKSFITKNDFEYLGNSSVTNGLESPERNRSTYSGNATEVYRRLQQQINNQKNSFEEAVDNLEDQLQNASGLYSTEEEQPDGSVIYYFHDKLTLAESETIIKITSQALGISTNGGESYPVGITVDGEAIVSILQTIGINADWINTGAIRIKDDDGNDIFYADMDTKQVIIAGDSVRIGDKTLPEAIEGARSLSVILDNEYQGIPADYEGNITTFPTVQTKVQVYLGSDDVSSDCIYSISESTSVAGSWNSSAKLYTVTDLLEDTGWVDITATYLGLFSATKRFNVQKVKGGEPGADGDSVKIYTLEYSTNIIKKGGNNILTPDNVVFCAYVREGDSTTRNEYFGRWKIEETTDGNKWNTVYESSENESSVTHFLYAILSDAEGNGISTANGEAISIVRDDIVAIRASLYAAGGLTDLIDSQTVSVVINADSLTHEDIFNLLTNNGEIHGIYQEGDQLYISFSYARGGVLQLGGSENEFGELSLLDGLKNKLVSLSNNGMVIYSASSSNQIGTIGVNRESDGREFISTEIFPESSGIEWTRINRNGEKRTLFRYNSSEEKEEEKIDLYMPFSVSGNNWNTGWDFLPVISSNVGNLSIRERKTSHNGFVCIDLNETGYTDGARDLNWFIVKENSENYAGLGFLQIYPGFMRIEDLYDSDALILGNDINMNHHQILNQSDERVKNNITEYNESAIEIINEIGIYEYDWIESGIHEDAGFIAQQLESIIPNAVKINKLGESYSVLPIKIIPYIVKSIQELSKEIELLKKEICELKGETYIPRESKKDKWKPSDMSLEEKREFIKSLKRAERRE